MGTLSRENYPGQILVKYWSNTPVFDWSNTLVKYPILRIGYMVFDQWGGFASIQF